MAQWWELQVGLVVKLLQLFVYLGAGVGGKLFSDILNLPFFCKRMGFVV